MTRNRPPKTPRYCRRCGTLFWRKCGNQRYCQSCGSVARSEYMKAYLAAYYRKNPEKHKAAARLAEKKNPERYRRLKREHMARKTKVVLAQIFNHYSGGVVKCACCEEPERDFLTLDHIAGNSNKTCAALGIPRAGTELYMWLARNDFPPGYQILCMNCNMSKGKHGKCIHQSRSPTSVS